MAEKRSHPDAAAEQQNGTKKSRIETSANGSQTANIKDQIAAAKAKAAAIKARQAASATSSAPTATPTTSVSGISPAESARAKIAALRARAAAATSNAASSTPQRTPITPPLYQPPLLEDGIARARGGLGIGLHPALMADSSVDSRTNKKGPVATKFSTTIGNRRPQSPIARPDSGQKIKKNVDVSVSVDGHVNSNPYIEKASTSNPAAPKPRKTRELVFNQKGKYIAQAANLRRQAQLEEMKKRIADTARKAAMNEDRSEQVFIVKDVPNLEWWDEGLIIGDSYPDFANEKKAEASMKINGDDSIITRYVQHPVLLQAPQERIVFQPKPMPLTSEEQAKKRRQDRMADIKERQAKVRLGLEPPEPPKVKKANLMRVLGEEAVKDPTAVEARVNREIAARAQRHEDTNDSRKLTKEERAEKIAANAEKNAARGLKMCVYRIDSLAYGKWRSRILMNAKEYKDLTGIMITNPNVNLVIIEAGSYAINKFDKLMLQRTDWTENAPSTVNEIDVERKKDKGPTPVWLKPEDEDGRLKDLSNNRCVRLWEGDIKTRNFQRWSERDCETDGHARQVLEKNKMENMWQLAKNYSSVL